MKKILILTVLFFASLLYAKIEVRYVVTEGIGSTKNMAVKNALIEAIRQTKGVAISSRRTYSKRVKESALSVDGDSSHGISINEDSRKKIQEATKGFIRSYSIVDSYRDGDGWHVKVRIKIKHYKTPGLNPNKRRKMAILPFEYKKSYVVLGNYESGKEISNRFTQALVSKITQSRKFTVLDRENSSYYRQEKNFILSGDSRKEEYLKLGNRLGADYLLVGKLLNYEANVFTQKRDLEGSDSSSIVCKATISYRIIAMATQQIKWSETIFKNISIPENQDVGSAEALVAYTTDKLAGIILKHILSNIYPPRIVAVTSNSTIVNQGGNSINVGDIYDVYKTGKRLVDPYTHEFLGYDEIKVGTIEITKVRPKISYAKVVQGRAVKGAILRIKSTNKKERFESKGEKKANIRVAPGGGVKLPFD